MKKFLFALMAVCLTFAMIGCDKDKPGGSTDTYITVTYDVGEPSAPQSVKDTVPSPVAILVVEGEDCKLTAGQLPDLADWTDSDGIDFEFVGWFMPDGTTEVDLDTVFTENVTIKAKWDTTVPNTKVLVYFDKNFGTGYEVTKKVFTVAAAVPDADWPTALETRTGFVFKGWYTVAYDDGMGEGTDLIPYTKASTFTGGATLELFAYWEWSRYTFTFKWNDGWTAEAPGVGTADETITVQENFEIQGYLPKTIPVRAGLEFAGWQAAAENTGSNFDFKGNADATPPVPPLKATANATYYARWWSTVLTDGDSTAIEKLALENGAYALYKFVIPAGKVLADYKGVSADYKVSESGLHKDIRGARVMAGYRADLLCDIGGSDGGNYYKLFTKDKNNVWSIKWIAGTPYNGDYILNTKLNYAGGRDGNTNTGLATAIKGYDAEDEDTFIEANEWFTLEYIGFGDSVATNPGRAGFAGDAERTVFIGLGLTRAGGRDLSLPHLIKNVKLLGQNPADDVVGTKPANSFEEPMFAGYLTADDGYLAVQQSWRGAVNATPEVTQTADTTKVYRLTNPVFKGYGDTNTPNENGSWTFFRKNYGSMVNFDFSELNDGTGASAELLKEYSQITVHYTLTKDTTQEVTPDTGPMKLTITNRAHATYGAGAIDWAEGLNVDPFANAWFDYNANGTRYITLPLSAFSESTTTHKVKTGEKDENDEDIEIDVVDYGYFFDIQHNDGGTVTSANNIRFNIRINQIVFEK
jgi:hypothetical protein